MFSHSQHGLNLQSEEGQLKGLSNTVAFVKLLGELIGNKTALAELDEKLNNFTHKHADHLALLEDIKKKTAELEDLQQSLEARRVEIGNMHEASKAEIAALHAKMLEDFAAEKSKIQAGIDQDNQAKKTAIEKDREEVEEHFSSIADKTGKLDVRHSALNDRETALNDRHAALDNRGKRLDAWAHQLEKRHEEISARETAHIQKG